MCFLHMDEEEDIVPHIMFFLHMVLKSALIKKTTLIQINLLYLGRRGTNIMIRYQFCLCSILFVSKVKEPLVQHNF